MNTRIVSPSAFDRMLAAAERVQLRLRRAAQLLEAADIAYAVAGGHAVAAWIAEVDDSAVRNTPDIDILIRRADFDRVRDVLSPAGIEVAFQDANSRARDAVHIVFAGEKVRQEYLLPAPDVGEARATATFRVLDLEPLVAMKLTSFRRKDQVHLLDMIGVGLIDRTWIDRLPAELAPRLQELLDNPDD